MLMLEKKTNLHKLTLGDCSGLQMNTVTTMMICQWDVNGMSMGLFGEDLPMSQDPDRSRWHHSCNLTAIAVSPSFN